MPEKREKIFVKGMTSQDIPDTTPDFILGKGGFNVDDMINFLNENKKFAINGWLNYTILRSKSTNKRYVELDMYFYDKQRTSNLNPDDKATIQAMREQAMAAQDPKVGDDPNKDIPF